MADPIEKAKKTDNNLYLIYDNECLLCRQTAKAIRLKKAVGQLVTINARTEHPLVAEVINKGYNLDEGIVIKYFDQFYYCTDAINLLALLSTPVNMFNRINAFLFRHQRIAKALYPILKLIRKFLLLVRRTPKIHTKNN